MKLTVSIEMPSFSAIKRVLWPSSTSSITCRSRRVSTLLPKAPSELWSRSRIEIASSDLVVTLVFFYIASITGKGVDLLPVCG